ncbi:type I-E CRISPR-associated protein Cse1/CasA [Streptomyces cellulosae]|uniref:Type I-E CRISPR-associated protein Cse1/CasA n=1 Tax=Streptomyces althioticus TaxID=83380 RepID=A0ABZ1YGD0_9ACTN|nr:type I-E CRISPR-associated protein Cse1/CasA [Streptomyces cellulosae]WTB86547.1 type I-E CRISPR-associated protein Cse1/CasA [Streptomyces cellulosae]WTB93356.1 type I-E CRISPR-associated protein Cse1/CasA [Streptomyces cellulosae]WTC60748.1 type I-E CRISPR-associated protein Cse1/CasA [Streptomyces cellulosae]
MTAPPSFSLASRPWLTVIDTSGRTHRCSLAEALENAGRLHLAAPDPLLWAATARLLTAVAYSAGCAPPDDDAYWANITGGIDLTAAVDWVREHTADLDLFAPDRPLFQDGALHEVSHLPEATMPVLYLDLSAAIGRPLLSDHRHLHTSVPVDARRAAELLLVQQTWAVGGRISAKTAVFGPGCNFGRSTAASGGVMWQPAGTISEFLAWRLMPVPGGPGHGHWTYTPRVEGTTDFLPEGECDALTWMTRRMLLLPDADGMVARVMMAQGWRVTKQPNVPISIRHGSRDVVGTEKGKQLSAEGIGSDDDVAPLLELWGKAPPGSWAHAARTAIAATGQAPDVVAVALATDNRKILHQRRIHIPRSALADPRSPAAAAAVMSFRWRAGRAAPSRRTNPACGTVLPPAFGASALLQEEFLALSGPQIDQRLLQQACATPSGDPVHDGERSAALAAALSGANADDDDLFTTASRPPSLPPSGTDDSTDPDAEGADHPGHVLAVQMGRWLASPRMRPVIADLERWASHPQPDNPAIALVTRPLAPEHHQAGILTAALMAIHHRTNRRAPLYGKADLPRLMRAFGSGRHYGPAHPATRGALQLMVRTTSVEALRPYLARQIRYAASKQMAPRWSSLFDDLAGWDRAVRERWSQQFFTAPPRRPAPRTGASSPTVNDHDKDSTTT